jgi:hypothetical protein
VGKAGTVPTPGQQDVRGELLKRLRGDSWVALVVPPLITTLVLLGIWEFVSTSGMVD